MAEFSHLDERGRARMVDVSGKEVTDRLAIARGAVHMAPETLRRIAEGGVKKGDVLSVARLAGIMGAKRTADLIPLCHPLPLSSAEVELTLDEAASSILIEARCKVQARTGVEMEALTAVSVAALTVYDMCKSLERGMRVDSVRLTAKSGGRSGDWHAD